MQSPSFARLLRFAVFALLLTSTAVAIVLSERMWRLWRPGELPSWAPFAAPACFVCLLVVFALDRIVAVRRDQEAAPRAFMQVGAAIFLLSLLLPQEAREMRRAWHERRAGRKAEQGRQIGSGPSPWSVLLQHRDPAVRQATCLLMAWSAWQGAQPGDGSDLQDESAALESLVAEVHRLSEVDASAEVRAACGLCLERLQDDLTLADQAPAEGEGVPLDNGTEYL